MTVDSQTALQIAGLGKTYNGKSVLENIHLDVEAGEYLALIGVNGAGKTTLIKCVLDLSAVDSGSIRLFDSDHRQTRSRQRITYLPEKFNPPYYLTGHDFLAYMAALHNRNYTQSELQSICTVLDFDIAALEKPVRQLSKGMGQKLGLAASFLSDKALMIFDEPMGGLDPIARSSLKKYLQQLKEQRRTLFFSTHQLADVELLCDRMAVLDSGRIAFLGTPAECREKYSAGNLEEAYVRCVRGQ